MDLSSFETWEIGVHIIEIVAIVILWINRKGRVASEAVETVADSVNARVDEVQLKMVELDTQLKTIHMDDLRKEIGCLHGEVKKMEGQLVGIEKALTQLAGMINAGLVNNVRNDRVE